MDMTKLRENDRPYVGEVVDYLRERGLEVSLKGSAIEGDKQYHDIDLLAQGVPMNVSDALLGLKRHTEPSKKFPERAADGTEYQVEHTSGPTRYMRNTIDERFKISVGETEIDVGLKTLPIGRGVDGDPVEHPVKQIYHPTKQIPK